VTYHGTVAELTRTQDLSSGGQILAFAAAFANSMTQQPGPTGGSGGGGGGETLVPQQPDSGNLPGDATGPPTGTETISQPGGGPGSGNLPAGGDSGGGSLPTGAEGGNGGDPVATAGGGDEGRLPYTGLAVIGVAGVGAALASAGAVMRRIAGRSDEAA
jgi:hypothetical protein